MSKCQKVNGSSSSSEVDYVRLCEDVVQRIDEVLKCGQVLNSRQCKGMAKRLSERIAQFHEAMEGCGSYKFAFVLLLAALHRYYVVNHCAQEDWCVVAVFMYGLRYGFRCRYQSILGHIDCTWKKILELAKRHSADSTTTPNLFLLDVSTNLEGSDADREEMMKRLEVLEDEDTGSFKVFRFFSAQQVDLRQQHLARYLLKKYRVPVYTVNVLKGLLWDKEEEPVDTWGILKFLGDGSGANGVWETTWLGVPCAKKEFHGETSETNFFKEALIMAKIPRHPHIVDFICCGNGVGRGERFIAMELMEKSLFDLIKERKGVHFSLDVALDIVLQTADGVKHLHSQNVAHRDLKPQNVVVKTLRSPYHEDYYCVKLVDFGSCKSEVEASEAQTMSYRGIGTTFYRAPEAHPEAHVQGMGQVNWRRADAYSFAMTCAHVLTLTTPFEGIPRGELYTKISEGQRPVFSSGCPEKLVDLVKECWITDSSKRPSFTEIYERLEKIIFDNMLVPFSTLKNSEVITENTNGGMHDIKEEESGMKTEGDTSFFTAENGSVCSEVVSERDSKSDVSKLSIVKLES